MPPILTIAHLTLREASRRRLLLAVFTLTTLLCILTGWGFHKIMGVACNGQPCSPSEIRDGVSGLLILLVFMFSIVLAVGAAFVTAPSIAADVESGLVLSMLPRPIRRSDLVLGKWLGLSIILALYGVLACALEFVIVKIATGYVPPQPVQAILFIVGEAIVILTLTLLWSTRLSAWAGGIISLGLFGMAWISGIAGAIGAAFGNQAITNYGAVANLILPTDGLWRGALYNLEPAVLVAASQGHVIREAAGNAFTAQSAPSLGIVLWSIAWVLGVLVLSAWSFQRREL